MLIPQLTARLTRTRRERRKPAKLVMRVPSRAGARVDDPNLGHPAHAVPGSHRVPRALGQARRLARHTTNDAVKRRLL